MRIGVWLAVSLFLSLTGAVRADTLDDIKKRGEMVIGLEAAYVPYESIKDGKIIGFDCDIGQHFADKLGVKVKFVDTEWSGIIPALYTKKFDAILSGMTITGERAQKVLFSQPYAEASNMVLIRMCELLGREHLLTWIHRSMANGTQIIKCIFTTIPKRQRYGEVERRTRMKLYFRSLSALC